MTIKEIKEALLGKNIHYYNGWNGTGNYFIIGHVVRGKYDRKSVRVFHEKGKGFGIVIPGNCIKPLIENGEHIEKNEIERCPFEERWRLTDSNKQNL